MDRHAVALVLQEIASLLQGDTGNRFRARAFRTAARAVAQLDGDLTGLVASGGLVHVRGIGPATARVIEELVLTGESSYHATLLARGPATLSHLLRVPGLGVKKIQQLHAELGIGDLDALEEAARSGRIAMLRGFGERTQQAIIAGIPFARGVAGRRTYLHAADAAHRLCAYMRALPQAANVAVAGLVRRRHEVVDGIVIVAAAVGEPQALVDAIVAGPGLTWQADSSNIVRAHLADGVPVQVQVCGRDAFGATLFFATGSDAHIAAVVAVAAGAGMRLSGGALHAVDGGIVPLPEEVELYERLGLQYVPPELREDGREVEEARHGRIPRLLELSDLRGCFHCHTTWSDGTATVEEMGEGALDLGWRYLGIADHSRSAGYAGGLSADAMRRQHSEIDAWNRRRGGDLHIFKGVEADILQDGGLDFAAQGERDVLDRMDYVVASVHSRFKLDRAGMTRRMVAAVKDPSITFLGHATGRLLLIRDAYDVDLDAVIQAAAEHGAAIEINADPRRLDLSWQFWPLARRLGVRTAINPDAHSVDGMSNVEFGVGIARKAWLGAAEVVNAWDIELVQEYFAERKARGREA
jgi:DNA polymerase (family X)